MHENRCIGLYRCVSDANVRKRAQDHRGPGRAERRSQSAPPRLHGPTRFRELRTLCLFLGPQPLALRLPSGAHRYSRI
jgi:hypothetical protein